MQKKEVQNSILLRIGNVGNLPPSSDVENPDFGRCKKLPNSAPASIAPPLGSAV